MKTNLDALLTALYVHLDDHVLRSADRPRRRGPERVLNDAELVCVAVAQVLLGCDSERRWLRTAPRRIGHLFPRLPGQSEYNRHLRDAAPPCSPRRCGWSARRLPGRSGCV
ncbi:hypothetical protein BJY14_004444 [Actinomadura luteofluorescens]|uniref:Transposase n=1 Tax=Actinomadura luteofluorescens TaxID=46163 RepID=A0A7Y9EIK4_9ACTN|nr:hypothetical protein [Actinomadura luteofluorescens]NYD48461.1 hypothetical protein [Actinomadura luteofluorescens]